MDSSGSNPFDIFDVYRLYCDAISGSYPHQSEGYRLDDKPQQAIFSREILSQLLKLVESRFHPRISIFDELFKLMLRLDLMVEFSEFSRFYDFVFFICRENGQKSITVSRAIMAWRLVLAGRFRMLNQWCNFVEKNQRHNISEDAWRQVLAFSRCVREDLEGYDPEGAWPVLIDDFVEHMYRIIGLNETPNSFCNCCDPDAQPLEDTLPGLKICPGLKRKSVDVFQREEHEYEDKFSSSSVAMSCKRRNIYYADKFVHSGRNPSGVGTEEDFMENVRQNCSPGCSPSPCAIEGCLAKGFAGLLSSRACLQFERDNRVSYT